VAGSPADEAGLQVGDVIVSYAGRAVGSRRELQFLIAGTSPGTEVELSIDRAGVRQDLRARPVEWQEETSEAAAAKADMWLGLEVAPLAGNDPRVVRLRDMLGVAPTMGIMVVAVEDGRAAADAGIRPGDVLVSIDGHELADLADWEQARDLLAGRREPLTILVRTGTAEQYLPLVPRGSGLEN